MPHADMQPPFQERRPTRRDAETRNTRPSIGTGQPPDVSISTGGSVRSPPPGRLKSAHQLNALSRSKTLRLVSSVPSPSARSMSPQSDPTEPFPYRATTVSKPVVPQSSSKPAHDSATPSRSRAQLHVPPRAHRGNASSRQLLH
eukprot:4122713-Prymnesium_polylepis.1